MASLNKENLVKIGEYIIKGMTEKESCALVDVKYNDLLQAKENDEIIRTYLDKKNIEFKLLHIETIQKSKSDKNSMYLLEKLRPAEFGTKAKQEGPTINIISAIIKDIQNDNTQSLITLNRGERKIQQDDTDRIIAGAKLLA